jgi:serine/threonine-protein kinase
MSCQPDNLGSIRELFGARYQVGDPIGKGAMSTVLSATRREDNLPVAIKVQRYDPDHAQRNLLKGIVQRVERCAQIRHHNVVGMLEVVSRLDGDDQLLAVVLERVGPTLPVWLTEHASFVTIGRLLELIRHVAAGIDEIHRHRIVHCDIKPSNILMSTDCEVAKIGDFSIAITEEESGKMALEDVWGTPAFVAPEQILSTTYGPRADIYAFGMTIYVLLSGQFAFEAKSPRELIYAQMSSTPVPIRRRNRSWPAELDMALMRALQKEPHLRQSTATELAAEVSTALAAHTPLRLLSFTQGELSRFSSGEVRVKDLF